MSRRRSGPSVTANPVLIGAATTLVVIVAIFLAFNANNGLPFVPTYRVIAEVPNAADLVKGNDVRIGGTRVGVLSDIRPKRDANGRFSALLTMKLQTSVRPLAVDSTILIRPRSALGLKYVEITRGTSRKGFADGATIPIANATPKPVEIDEVFNTFDAATRRGSQGNLTELGNGLAGRGPDLNLAIFNLGPLLTNIVPVARNLSNPSTRVGDLFTKLERAARIVAPAAETQGTLFVNLDTTFRALGRVARPYIQQTISGANPALDAATRSFPVQRPFLRHAETLFRELRPGVRALGSAAGPTRAALAEGIPTLRQSDILSVRLQRAFVALRRFSTSPLSALGLSSLTRTARELNPTLRYLRPAQTRCSYVTLWFRNVSSLLSEGDRNGTWERFSQVLTPSGPTAPNNESGPSSAPANGPTKENHVHVDPYPNVGAPGQPVECEAANEDYISGRTVIGNVPGNQGTAHEVTKIDRSR